ncbi:hypothetical protein RH08_05055 [Candidatus Liberibacter asiaticus]|uniref:Uncharacterized protein n=4 Tax=Liberibacter asiaticus TaxID=34021 RepID=C6XGU9_LIBAP|nr:hypothetical protein CLIBASIA_05155 [Candidatus Liberibacter asiaticus str. psy62]AGH17365.1 hypothetical protein WSI_04985 [Candidatus Liberibacter asiaticus str. gxpsy]ALK07645.1 hypothetical protein CD16_05040 [Candidatus Liberibacter asiaticus]BAP26898.1 hypothetical protein CGUJ_05155 [Candidatus Liberibacter asiaticus str. Ishi-1]ASK53138.1 hypothetical protein B2I23_05110 [Candidatus Liberibacter asiaticus]
MLRDGLHKAASNALNFATTQVQYSTFTPEKMKLSQDYLGNTNPDAVNQLNLDDQKINNIILSKAMVFPNQSDIASLKEGVALNLVKDESLSCVIAEGEKLEKE